MPRCCCCWAAVSWAVEFTRRREGAKRRCVRAEARRTRRGRVRGHRPPFILGRLKEDFAAASDRSLRPPRLRARKISNFLRAIAASHGSKCAPAPAGQVGPQRKLAARRWRCVCAARQRYPELLSSREDARMRRKGVFAWRRGERGGDVSGGTVPPFILGQLKKDFAAASDSSLRSPRLRAKNRILAPSRLRANQKAPRP